jgi:CheY-like chemotaxis protein
MPRRNSAPSTESAQILLVNRSANGRTARKAVLEELGHCVTVSASAADALEQCAKQAFQLVVTDVDFMVRLRKQTSELPIIFISDVVDPLGLNEENTGADAVIQKSANEVTHLIRAVGRLLRRKPGRKPAAGERSGAKARAKSV